MFFSGTLREALASAVQSSKAVLCFVTDDGEESQLWESDFLADELVSQSVRAAAVALRLKAGSQEAGYLAALFPLPKIPTVIILRNGELKEYMPSGTSKDDFSRRVQAALGASAPEAQEPPPPPADPSPQAQEVSPGADATDDRAPAPEPVPASTHAVNLPAAQPAPATAAPTAAEDTPALENPTILAPSTNESGASGVHPVLAERAARLEKQREEAKKRALEAYAKAKAAKGKENADPDSDGKDKATRQTRDDFADSVKRKQREARDERNRILKRIEDDKAARRDQAASRAAQRTGAASASASGPSTSATRSSDVTAILVRLYDGSTLRSRFPKGASIREDVRKWVDSNRKDGSTGPYKFRVAVDPTASRLIDETEEDRTLEDLGLTPSATLVLVPIPKFVTANAGGGGGDGVVQSTTALFMWLFTIVSTFFTSLVGGGAASRPEEIEMDNLNQDGTQEPQRARGSGSRVHSLQDPARQRRDQQFYNGNSLNFEPRPDDEEP